MPLANVLFGDYRQRVLGLLLLNPEMRFYLREIARRTGAQVGALSRELNKLTDAGILLTAQSGNQVHYFANRECPVFEELASILRKTSGLVDVLRDGLAALELRIRLAFVYGSMAKGKAVSASDIDLMIIGDVGFAEATTALYPAQETLCREINPKVYSWAEWQQLLSANGAFIQDVMRGAQLFVIGSAADLQQTVPVQ